MLSIHTSGVKELSERFLAALKEAKPEKAKLLDSAGQEILESVREKIGGSGTVQSWQEYSVGSNAGYVAVRPMSGYEERDKDELYNVGYITNAIENGHYRRGLHFGESTKTVAGKRMYLKTRPEAERIAQQTAERIASMLAEKLEVNR